MFAAPAFYLPPPEVIILEVAREQRGHFNVIHADTGFKADFYTSGRDELYANARVVPGVGGSCPGKGREDRRPAPSPFALRLSPFEPRLSPSATAVGFGMGTACDTLRVA